MISVLDGFSRAILSWDIRTRMESFDAQIVLWRACDKWLNANNPNNPRLITDNGSQFLTSEFKATLKEFSMKNVRTSVNHPQSNGKLERFHGTIKSEAIRDMPKFTLEQIKKEIGEWIHFYNYERLHSSIDYVAQWTSSKVEEILFYQNESENCLKENRNEKNTQSMRKQFLRLTAL
ncbi:MAG: transposase family protein [Leptospiraceae bacterium]|nr:transposase family protein [Leptospiraceae bacterium]